MFKNISSAFFILFSLTSIYECNSGSRRRIPKVIVLSDENSTLEIDTQYFIDLDPDTFKDIPSFNDFPTETCPIVREQGYVGRLPFISTNKDYDLHKAVENNQYQLSKFILQFHRPGLNVKLNNKTVLERAINNTNPKIIKLLLSQSDVIIDEDYLRLAKESCSFWRDKREYYGVVGLMHEIPDKSFYVNNIQKTGNNIKKTKKIGQMLINHVGLYSGQSRISKSGIVGAYGLPVELAVYIATFMYQ